ncbi:hypothetical protein N7527_010379 [Penicillium freii]|nr:hypothetical protein N7527_010379 [Penicillium freii]
MNNLASMFWNQGQWEEAEQLFVQVMETSKTKLGADNPDTLSINRSRQSRSTHNGQMRSNV